MNIRKHIQKEDIMLVLSGAEKEMWSMTWHRTPENPQEVVARSLPRQRRLLTRQGVRAAEVAKVMARSSPGFIPSFSQKGKIAKAIRPFHLSLSPGSTWRCRPHLRWRGSERFALYLHVPPYKP